MPYPQLLKCYRVKGGPAFFFMFALLVRDGSQCRCSDSYRVIKRFYGHITINLIQIFTLLVNLLPVSFPLLAFSH